jgi:flagellar biosynthesis regulator FlbT
MVKQPVISKELIAYLEAIFPVFVPDEVVHDLHQVNVTIGHRQVLEHLRAVNTQQEDESYV